MQMCAQRKKGQEEEENMKKWATANNMEDMVRDGCSIYIRGVENKDKEEGK